MPRTENGATRVLDATLGRVPFVPLWCVAPVALVWEDDTGYYSRIDELVAPAVGQVQG
ncbi:hypothetical protein ACFWBR_41770 [Streptomyces sp. NPDC060006]|uniref:hypothetical protein n=1 Tax=unclassified Streptomyces TaxID=2593676 RepID=UPI0036B351CC